MTEAKRRAVARSIARYFQHIELADINSQSRLLLLERPELTTVELRHRLIDVFRLKAWSHSYGNRFTTIYSDALSEETWQPICNPESRITDALMAATLLEILKDPWRETVIRYYYEGKSQKEIADEDGVTRSAIAKRLKKSITDMRNRAKPP